MSVTSSLYFFTSIILCWYQRILFRYIIVFMWVHSIVSSSTYESVVQYGISFDMGCEFCNVFDIKWVNIQEILIFNQSEKVDKKIKYGKYKDKKKVYNPGKKWMDILEYFSCLSPLSPLPPLQCWRPYFSISNSNPTL